ncbi:MAG: hypothetical protein MJY49_03075 [Bacteroidales bacterium]|nr:hypothetical protein [Bacteroidales bacterium]
MKKTRLPRMKKYWYIQIEEDSVCVNWDVDNHNASANEDFERGNYFHTKEDAEAMIEKLRKVLAGADVIEIPSEEDIVSEKAKIAFAITRFGLVASYIAVEAASKMEKYFKSKIVK